MRRRGEISLLKRDGTVMDTKKYQTPWHRKKIIAEWKVLYVRNFNFCLLQINPETNQHLVNKDGTNRDSRLKTEDTVSSLPTKVHHIPKQVQKTFYKDE